MIQLGVVLMALAFSDVSAFSAPLSLSQSCEFRLGFNYTSLTLRAFAQGVISAKQVIEMSKAARPINPLQGTIPSSKTSAMMRVYDSYLAMSEAEWSDEKAKLTQFAATLVSDLEASASANASTAEVMSPKLLKHIKVEARNFAWGIRDEKIFYALVKDKHLALFRFGISDPLFFDQTEFVEGSRFWLDLDGAEPVFHYYRPQQRTSLEVIQYRGTEKFAGLHINLESGQHSTDVIFPKKKSVSNSFYTRTRIGLPYEFEKVGYGEGFQVEWNGRTETIALTNKLYDQTSYITEDGRRFFVGLTTLDENQGMEVLVYEPFVSKRPVFKSYFGKRDGNRAKITFFEKGSVINLMVDRAEGATQFFQLFAKPAPFATYDLSQWKSVFFHLVDGRYLVDFDYNQAGAMGLSDFYVVELYVRP